MEATVRQYIKEAMIEKNEAAKLTYRSILENAQKIAKADGNRAVTDNDFIKAAKNEIKQLKDLAEFTKNDPQRTIEIAEKISYASKLLPEVIGEQQILDYLTQNNVEKNIGVCMKTLKAQFGSALDGKMAQGVVRQYIEG